MAINWNEIYTKKWNELSKGYDEQKAQLNAAQSEEQSALDKSYKEGAQGLQKTRDDALAQAYVGMRQNERQLPARLKQSGLSGGGAETVLASLLRGYQNAKNAAQDSYQKAYGEYTGAYNKDSANLKSRYSQKLADLLAKQKEDAWNQAKFAYQAAVEQERMAEERRRWEAQLEAQNNRLRAAAQSAQASSYAAPRAYSAPSASSSGSGNAYAKGGYSSANGGYGAFLKDQQVLESKYIAGLASLIPMDVSRDSTGRITAVEYLPRAARAVR